MKKHLLELVTVLLITACKGQSIEGEHSLLLQEIIGQKQCITTINGKTECIKFNNKKIYILPYLDTLKSEMFLRTSNKSSEFFKLEVDFSVADSIRDSYGKPLNIDTKNFKANFVSIEKEAEIVISFTKFLYLDGNKYCVVQIKDDLRMWVLKAMTKNGTFKTELDLILP